MEQARNLGLELPVAAPFSNALVQQTNAPKIRPQHNQQELLQLPAIAELAKYNQWIVWKLIPQRNQLGELRNAKVPYNPRTHATASKSFTTHCTSFEVASAAIPRYTGMGFVFTADDPYTGIDLDGCRDPETGRIARWAWRWIMRLNSYTEVSPSGTGVKVFVRGVIPESIKGQLGKHVGIEVYSTARYFCVTGQHLLGTPKDIHDSQGAITHLYFVLTRLRHMRLAARRPVSARKNATAPVSENDTGIDITRRLSARETIDRANADYDLGDLLISHGATLVRVRDDVRYYDGVSGDTHSNSVTYIVTPAHSGCGHIGYSYSPNGKLNNGNFPRGFRWFDAYAELKHNGDIVAALKELSPLPKRSPRELPPHPADSPECPTVDNVEQRRQWREQKQQHRNQEREQRQHLVHHYSTLVANDSHLGERERAAWAVHCTFFASNGRHCVSVAAQAARLCDVEQANESHVRRMQRANERLIACGYLQRTDRRDGSNTQTSWWEPASLDVNRVTQGKEPRPVETTASPCEDEDRVTAGGKTVTLHEQTIHIYSLARSEACERGAEPAIEPNHVETFGHENEASFDPNFAQARTGSYTGRTKHSLSLDELIDASNEYWRELREAHVAEEIVIGSPENDWLDSITVGTKAPLPNPYRDRIALMDEMQLAGELRKHEATLRKYAGAHCLAGVRQKLRCIQQEIAMRQAARSKAHSPPHSQVTPYAQQQLFTLVPP